MNLSRARTRFLGSLGMSKLSLCRRLAFSLAAALLCVAVVEIGFRAIVAIRVGKSALLYGVRPSEGRGNVGIHDMQLGGYSKYFPNEPRHDYDPRTGRRFSVRINSDGFRGGDFPDVKEPGVLRVVTLGASSTFGHNNRDDETYPFYLQGVLNERCPEHRYEVFNLGIPHLDSTGILALFRGEALRLDPDVVTFYEGMNDCTHREERHHVRRKLRRVTPLRAVFRAARDRILLVKFLDDAVRPRLRTYDADEVEAHRAGRARRFVENVAAIRADCRARGMTFLVATQMSKSYLVPEREIRGTTCREEEELIRRKLERGEGIGPIELYFLTHAGITTEVRKWAADTGVPLVDVIAALDERRDVLTSWVHLTPEGNRMIAEAFADSILAITCSGAPRGAPGPAGGT
jgi:lysophospholipase L1-like esterase